MSRAPRPVVSPLFPVFAICVAILGLQGCSVYYNTFFNAEKAYDQAVSLREKRLDRNPEDTVTVAPEERAKLERAIVKSSKVLELWPDNRKYAPKAVFLIAESYLLMEEYDRAAPKYAEFIRYYPTAPEIPLARAHYAKALYLDGQDLLAREALAALIASNPTGEARREALLLSARMQVDENSGEEGLALYEKLLQEGAFTTPETRAEAHWQAARLAFSLGKWEAARRHALAPDMSLLPARIQYRNRKLAVLSLYALGRHDEGIAEVLTLSKAKQFRTVRPDLQLLHARGLDGKNNWPAANRLYRSAATDLPRSAVAAEAWYRVALHFWVVENREDSARAYFDSAAASGPSFEFGALGSQRAASLARVIELRQIDTTGGDSARPHYRSFMIAEIFQFELERPDSARVHLNRIVASPAEDSVFTRRALYALAWIEADSGRKERSDSLYRVVMTRYPGTEWAKQAEINLGLPSTIRTEEDLAHALFLEAERLRFAGESVTTRVVPAYREVAQKYPRTREAAKALFVAAFLTEESGIGPPRSQAQLDAARAAYDEVRKSFPETPYAAIAGEKVDATGGMPEPAPTTDAPSGEETTDEPDTSGAPAGESLDPQDEEGLY